MTPEQHTRFVNLCTMIASLLGALFIMSQRFVDPDLWGHIQYGADWINAGEMPLTASHTYADPSYVWVNHENIAELVMAVVHQYFGGFGLVVGKCLIGLFVLWLIRANAIRNGVRETIASLTLIPVAYSLASSWCVRPQLASFICFALMMWILESIDRNRESHQPFHWTIWFLVPLVTIWTNAHGGFLAGVCVLLAWLGLTSVRAILASGWQASRKLVLQSFVVGIGIVLAPFVNPYGADLPYWLAHSLGEARPEINEWASIIEQPIYCYPWGWVFGIAVVSWGFSKSKRNVAHLVIFALVALQSFQHLRHIPFMGLLLGFWIPPHLESTFAHLKRPAAQETPSSERSRRVTRWQFGIAVLLMAGLLIYQHCQFGVRRDEYPVAAAEFMAKHDLNGRIVVTFDWAQFALAALPESTVGFDGRFRTCYTQEVVDMHFDFITGSATEHRNRDEEGSGPFDPTKVLRFQDPQLAWIDRLRDRSGSKLLAEMPDWTILYRDSVSEVWGRSELYDDPTGQRYLAPADRSISDAEQSGIAAWPGLPCGADGLPINSVFARR